MEDNKDIVVYLNDNQFNQLLDTMKNEKEISTTSTEVPDTPSDSSNSKLSELDLSCFLLLGEFIIIGILAWSLVMRK